MYLFGFHFVLRSDLPQTFQTQPEVRLLHLFPYEYDTIPNEASCICLHKGLHGAYPPHGRETLLSLPEKKY